MTTKQAHKITIKPVADPEFKELYGDAYAAHCSCGWTSDTRSTRERAERSAAAHVADQAPEEES